MDIKDTRCIGNFPMGVVDAGAVIEIANDFYLVSEHNVNDKRIVVISLTTGIINDIPENTLVRVVHARLIIDGKGD